MLGCFPNGQLNGILLGTWNRITHVEFLIHPSSPSICCLVCLYIFVCKSIRAVARFVKTFCESEHAMAQPVSLYESFYNRFLFFYCKAKCKYRSLCTLLAVRGKPRFFGSGSTVECPYCRTSGSWTTITFIYFRILHVLLLYCCAYTQFRRSFTKPQVF